ncbi:MAG: hypothetical protein V4710_04195 [Verrucomicrobiota bacterium]
MLSHPRFTHLRALCASSLIECTIATGVVALFLSEVFALNNYGLMLVRSAKNSTAAEQCARDRLEKMRNASWERMTDPLYIRDTVLSSVGNSYPKLGGIVIKVNVMPYPLPSGTTGALPITVTRDANGTALITAAGTNNIVNERTVLVKVTITWPVSGRTRTREAYTLVSKGGISGRNK